MPRIAFKLPSLLATSGYRTCAIGKMHFHERKQSMLAAICAQRGAEKRKTANAGVPELLATMTAQMRSEEPVQERTSYS